MAGSAHSIVRGSGIHCIYVGSCGVVMHRWDGEEGQEGVGAIFMAGEMLEGKTDLTTGFPDIENGAGEVLVVVAKP